MAMYNFFKDYLISSWYIVNSAIPDMIVNVIQALFILTLIRCFYSILIKKGDARYWNAPKNDHHLLKQHMYRNQ